MPVQINITGDNANQAHQEFMNLHTLMSGSGAAKPAEAPATAPTSGTPVQTPTQQQDYTSFGQTQQQWQPQQQGGVPVQQQYGQQYGQPQQQGYGQPQQHPVGGSVPTSTPSYTMDQLGVAVQPILDAGRQGELFAWLQQHGAQALTQLNPQHYGEFATYLRSLGAKI
jgi:hypothetical protein